MDNLDKLVRITDEAGYFATESHFETGTNKPLMVTTYAQVREAVCKAYKLGLEETQTSIRLSCDTETKLLKSDVKFLCTLYTKYIQDNAEFVVDLINRLAEAETRNK